MKKLLSITTLVLATMFIVTSCGKFEEGPKLSLKSKKARLANTWVYESIIVDDVAATDISFYDGVEITFDKDGTYSVSFGSISDSGTWEFSGDVDLKTTTSTSTSTSEIVKLKSNELWIKDVSDAGVVTVSHMIPK